jgi:hypothetical protein
MLETTRKILQEPTSTPRVSGRIGLSHCAAHRGAQPLGQRLDHVHVGVESWPR